MRHPRTTGALLAALVLGATAPAALADPVEETAALGGTHATLTYERAGQEVTGMALRVVRHGEVVVDGPVSVDGCAEPPHVRKPTRVPAAARRQRLADKRQRSELKLRRSRHDPAS